MTTDAPIMDDLPTYDQLMYPTLRAVEDLGGSATRQELIRKVLDEHISPEHLSAVHGPDSRLSGEPKAINRIEFAIAYLKLGGFLVNTKRAIWTITSKGRNCLSMEEGTAIKTLDDDSREARNKKTQHKTGEQGHLDTDYSWQVLLLDILKQMDPSAFERLSLLLLRTSGFNDLQQTKRSGDGGIDGIGVYKFNLISTRVYIQCKRYKDTVRVGDIRQFQGVMGGRGGSGLFITTGTFTKKAREEASRDGAQPIDLIDGDELCILLKEYGLGVQAEEKEDEEYVTVDKEFFEQFQQPEMAEAVAGR